MLLRSRILVSSSGLLILLSLLLSCAPPAQQKHVKTQIDFDALAAAELGAPGAGVSATSNLEENSGEVKKQREEIQQLKRNVVRQLLTR